MGITLSAATYNEYRSTTIIYMRDLRGLTARFAGFDFFSCGELNRCHDLPID